MSTVANVNGLISGIQTDSIIQQLTQFEQQAIQQYQSQQNGLQSKISAYQQANTRLAAVRDAASDLAQARSFATQTASSSNSAILTAVAGSGASPGDYTVTVNNIARAHQIVSQSFADLDTTTVGTGSFAITSGGKTTTINVDSSNNTLGGLRDAINRANSNVSASIVRDGDSSYRLLISARQTGTANSLTINSTLSGGSAPTMTDLQPAVDATVTLGSGANAINVTRSTNVFQDLIPGVTMNLASADANKPVTVTVSRDTQGIESKIQKLVGQYNNAVDFFNTQFKFDPETKTGGTLVGDFTLSNIQSQIADVFSSSVAGPSAGYKSLAEIGISTGADGKLTFDQTAFEAALANNPDAVTQVFALTAKSTNVGVQYVAAGAKTTVDGTALAVNITQAARQARVTSGVAQSAPLDADETVTINGTAIQLTAGMTQAQVITALNAHTADTGVIVKGTAADGSGTGSFLTFQSTPYGASAKVSIVSSLSNQAGNTSGVGNVTASQGSPGGEGGAGTGAAGLDVMGTINGEAATGTGQILIGNAGNTKTDGLRLRITSATTGALGTISLYEGIADSAARNLNQIIDPVAGPIQGEEDSLTQRIKDLQAVIVKTQQEADDQTQTLKTKFNDLEATLGQLQSQSSYLASQIGALSTRY